MYDVLVTNETGQHVCRDLKQKLNFGEMAIILFRFDKAQTRNTTTEDRIILE